ncbi:MAG: methyltransferase domain-containing protein [Alphaproteobacteria bacterium]|nr:methyltransferase domain-containing protein [Alphaproteobacteria bacterium]
MTAAPISADAYDDLWAAGWDDTRLYGPMARHSRRLFASLSSDLSPTSILDVGCGEGSLLSSLMKQHPDAAGTGVEVSDHAIALAAKVVPSASFRNCDVATAALPETFDLVVSADVVEHIADDAAAIRNMASMTAPGGRLIISTLQGRMRNFERQVGHVRNYAPNELESKMRDAGLKIERVVAWGWPFYSPLYRDLLDIMDNKGTMGRFGLIRKTICHILYGLFLLNRSTKGDYIFVRAVKEHGNV